MKNFLTITFVFLIATGAFAQRHKPASSKRATKVDSISAPPRMDGNTGHYDTVRNAPKLNRRVRKSGRVHYNYDIKSDTIGVNPSRPK